MINTEVSNTATFRLLYVWDSFAGEFTDFLVDE